MWGIRGIPRFIVFYYSLKIKPRKFNAKKMILGKYDIQLLPSDVGISKELSVFGIHEPLTTKVIQDEIKDGMYCFDLGGNIGYYAVIESNLVGRQGKVFAVEPSPLNYNLLKTNLDNQKMDNFSVFNIAIGDKDGEIEFIVTEKSNLCKVKTSDKEVNELENIKVIKVQSKTLDSFVLENNIEKIDFLRMDLEGYEYNVIMSSKSILEKYKPKLLMEIHWTIGTEKTIEFLKFLQNLNYEIKYFMLRKYDIPMCASPSKHIEKISMNQLLSKVKNNDLCNLDFTLFLE